MLLAVPLLLLSRSSLLKAIDRPLSLGVTGSSASGEVNTVRVSVLGKKLGIKAIDGLLREQAVCTKSKNIPSHPLDLRL